MPSTANRQSSMDTREHAVRSSCSQTERALGIDWMAKIRFHPNTRHHEGRLEFCQMPLTSWGLLIIRYIPCFTYSSYLSYLSYLLAMSGVLNWLAVNLFFMNQRFLNWVKNNQARTSLFSSNLAVQDERAMLCFLSLNNIRVEADWLGPNTTEILFLRTGSALTEVRLSLGSCGILHDHRKRWPHLSIRRHFEHS